MIHRGNLMSEQKKSFFRRHPIITGIICTIIGIPLLIILAVVFYGFMTGLRNGLS